MFFNASDPNKTDEELVVLTLKDKENYRHLMERYEKKLTRYIIRISGIKRDDAEDVLQESFIKAYQKINNFDFDYKFSSWMYRIAHNETFTYLRKKKARPKVIDSEFSSIILDSLKDDLNIEKEIDKKYLAKHLSEIMSGISEKYRVVLTLKYLEDKDYQEISDILKKPMGTVATLLKRAKEQLKKEIIKNQSTFRSYGQRIGKNF
jgi:RNA polymerase sigma-70 factor (ECF subfamily)